MTLRLHISEQGGFFDESFVAPLAVGDVLTMHGTPLKGIVGESHATFIGYSQATIQTAITNYLTSRGIDYANDQRTFILDLEAPNDGVDTFAHPADLHLADSAKQLETITAWKVRIAAARAVLPRARIGMYGTLIPDARGRADNATYLARLACLRDVAGPAGLFDGLDFLIPILYPKFGTDDNLGAFYSNEAYTALGITGSRELRRSNGKRLPLLPLFAFSVFNASSLNNDQQLLDLAAPLERTLGTPLDIVERLGVTDAALWTNNLGGTELLPDPNPNAWTVSDYVKRLNMATTFKLIRASQETALKALTPTMHPSIKFTPWRVVEGPSFEAWAQAHAEPFRQFWILHGFNHGDELPNPGLDSYREVHNAVVLVAYPNQETWGGDDRLDDIIDEDVALITKAVGELGYGNYSALGDGEHKSARVESSVELRGSARILRLTFRIDYDRTIPT